MRKTLDYEIKIRVDQLLEPVNDVHKVVGYEEKDSKGLIENENKLVMIWLIVTKNPNYVF